MNNTGKTVLFVEDNPLVITIYRNWLQREGFQVDSSSDGLDAIERLPQMKPSLVILDLMLPMLDGMDVLKFIREQPDLKEMPVLILSNAYMDDRAEKALKAGANKVLLKTQCTPAKLIQAVRELLGTETPAQTAAMHPAAQMALAEANAVLLQETRDDLFTDAPVEVVKIREYCLAFVKAVGKPESIEPLNNMYQRVRFLCARAGLGDCSKIAHLASALEAILFEIMFKKATPSASALQTIAQSVDCLGRLFQSADSQNAEAIFKARVLVVDDDPVCTFATVAAMKRAKLEAVSTLDPFEALQMAQQNHYDIVLLDINMPSLNGFEVCEKLRLLPDYKNTPVIFVTSNSEFQNRAQAVLSGGDDLIGKPISPLELALKTIIHLINPEGLPQPATMKKEEIAAPAVQPVQPIVAETVKTRIPETATPLPSKPVANGETENPRPLMSAIQRNATPMSRPEIPPKPEIPAPELPKAELPKVEPPKAELPKTELPKIELPEAKLPEVPPVEEKRIEPVMKNRTEQLTLDKLAREVAGIMFGDDKISETSLRLTRIALERCKVLELMRQPAGSKSQPFDRAAREIARIVFGDEGVSEMHLRLLRIALEHFDVPPIVNASAEVVTQNVPRTATGITV